MTVAEAATTRRKVSIRYRVPGRGAATERLVNPYKLVHHRGAWYVIAFDESRDDVRVFALSRMEATEITRETFRPPTFELSDYIDPSFGVHAEQEWFRVRIAAEGASADVVREHLPPNTTENTLDAGKGRREFVFETNQSEELKHWVMQWGEHVEVIEPESLRKELARIGQVYLQRYS